MVTSHLMGGLGNYMFQIAAAISLAEDNKDSVYFNFSKAQIVHSSIDSYKRTIFKNIKNDDILHIANIYKEPTFSYTPIKYNNKTNIKLHGYFQSEKYFKHNRNKILKAFSLDETIQKYIEKNYKVHLAKDTISLHVRRGDYLNYTGVYENLFKNKYYKRALSLFEDKEYTIFVFSDDIPWCKKNLKLGNHNVQFIERELDYIDMHIMSLCKNHIIANSSFSWWGAWLSNQNKVVAPKKWFTDSCTLYDGKDILPEKWIKI